MDRVLAGMLQGLLKGRGSWMTEKGIRTLPYQQLRKYWRIPKVEVLLRCLRLGWLQQMVADVENNIQVVCAIFGKLSCERHPTVNTCSGCLRPGANAWAKKLEADMLGLAETESGRELLDKVTVSRGGTWQVNFRLVFGA